MGLSPGARTRAAGVLLPLPLRAAADPLAPLDAAGAAAYDLLTMFGIVAVGWTWAELAALPETNDTSGAGEDRRRLAQVWFAREMPLLAALRARVEAGPGPLCDWPDDAV